MLFHFRFELDKFVVYSAMGGNYTEQRIKLWKLEGVTRISQDRDHGGLGRIKVFRI